MTIHQNTRRITMPKNLRAYAAAFALMTSAVSCDTDVVNPGPVADSDLDRNAATALVNGSGRALAQAINWISYTGAAVTREIHPAGSTGSWLGWGVGIFVLGWILQFIGHYYEGRKPAFVDDLVGLLVGPMFVVAEWLFAAGWGREVHAEIERRAGPTHLRDLAAPLAR